MIQAWELPVSLHVCGTDYPIRTDFRAVLDILSYFGNPEYETDEKWEICLDILYRDYEQMPAQHKEEAARQAAWFIDMGMEPDGKKPRTMDWGQDAAIILPAVNKVVGKEVRSLEYMHWWTFLGAYMEIGDSLFSQVVAIRQKKASGKHLDPWEHKFYLDNKSIIDLQKKSTNKEERDAVDALFGIRRR